MQRHGEDNGPKETSRRQHLPHACPLFEFDVMLSRRWRLPRDPRLALFWFTFNFEIHMVMLIMPNPRAPLRKRYLLL